MPTLGEAAQMLRIGRVTLEKWIKRLGIETTRHEWDYRYQVIAPEDVERIAEARRKLPHAPGRAAHAPTSPVISPYNSLAFNRSESAEGMVRDVMPSPTRTPTQRLLQRDNLQGGGENLPAGWMSRTDCADLHSFPRTTLRRWCEQGMIETSAETFGGGHGQFVVAQPVTARGMRQFYALASRRSDFTLCPSCPHETPEELPGTVDNAPETPAAEG